LIFLLSYQNCSNYQYKAYLFIGKEYILSNFDDFYDKKAKYIMKNGETFNDIQESLFTLEEKERNFGFIEIDENDDIWIIDIDDKSIKTKIENMDDFYAFLAKQKLAGNKE